MHVGIELLAEYLGEKLSGRFSGSLFLLYYLLLQRKYLDWIQTPYAYWKNTRALGRSCITGILSEKIANL